MRALYEWAGDELTPEVEQAMLDWLDRNPQDRFGARPYSLDSYGLSPSDLDAVFGDYRSTFAIELEGA